MHWRPVRPPRWPAGAGAPAYPDRPSDSSSRARRNDRSAGATAGPKPALPHQTVVVENIAAPAATSGPGGSSQRNPELHAAASQLDQQRGQSLPLQGLGFDPIWTSRRSPTIARVLNVQSSAATRPSSARGLIAAARPSQAPHASSGVGSSANAAGELFVTRGKIDVPPPKGLRPLYSACWAGGCPLLHDRGRAASKARSYGRWPSRPSDAPGRSRRRRSPSWGSAR